MSDTKIVRNKAGKDITVEYGGRDYRFDAGSEKSYPADLADVAQFRHGHEGLQIVDLAHEAQEAATKAAASAVATLPVKAEPASVESFTCPHGDFATNDKVAYFDHLASAHGLSEQQRAEADAKALPESKKKAPPKAKETKATPTPPAESPSTATAPAKASAKTPKKPAKKKEKK